MTLLSVIPSLTPTLDDYFYAADADLGGSPTEQADGRVTFTAVRDLLEANLTTAVATTGYNISTDVKLVRDAANVLAQRNLTAAQAFRVYNTYTDASNYERGFIRYVSNVLQIGHTAAGTGTSVRDVEIHTGDHGFAPFKFSTPSSAVSRFSLFRPSTGVGPYIEGTNTSLTLYAPGGQKTIVLDDNNGLISLTPNTAIAAAGTASVYIGNQEVNAGTMQMVGGFNASRNRAGHAFTVKGGQAAGAGNNNGGDLQLYGGDKVNSGVEGAVKIALNAASLLGFHAVTPVAQQAGTGLTTGFTAGSGTAANDDSTYTGNSGTKAYTVGDIVLALKNYGLLAAS